MSAPRLGRTDPTPAVWDSDIIAKQMLPDCEASARQRESETLQVRTDEIKGLPRAQKAKEEPVLDREQNERRMRATGS